MKYFITLLALVLFSAPAYSQVSTSYNWWSGFTHQQSVTQSNKKQRQRVTMYSTTHCHFCKQARHYFRANNIPYLERNIDRSSDALRRFKAMKAFGTPTIVLGKRTMIGFDIPRFQRFYR